jgi:hypothetical protein
MAAGSQNVARPPDQKNEKEKDERIKENPAKNPNL